MTGLTDLGWHNVNVDSEQATLLNRAHNGVDQRARSPYGTADMASFTRSVRFLYACLNCKALSVVL